MGRLDDLDRAYSGKVSIRAVPLDEGGYDPGGSYWGTGEGVPKLFCISSEDAVAYVRASDFDAAKAQFPNVTWESSHFCEADLEDMLLGYSEAALWLSTFSDEDGDDVPMDSVYTVSDLAPETTVSMRKGCLSFAEANSELISGLSLVIDIDWAHFGHDFYLTSSGAGAGFGDGDYPEPYDKALFEAAKWGEKYLYAGDDNLIYMG